MTDKGGREGKREGRRKEEGRKEGILTVALMQISENSFLLSVLTQTYVPLSRASAIILRLLSPRGNLVQNIYENLPGIRWSKDSKAQFALCFQVLTISLMATGWQCVPWNAHFCGAGVWLLPRPKAQRLLLLTWICLMHTSRLNRQLVL